MSEGGNGTEGRKGAEEGERAGAQAKAGQGEEKREDQGERREEGWQGRRGCGCQWQLESLQHQSRGHPGTWQALAPLRPHRVVILPLQEDERSWPGIICLHYTAPTTFVTSCQKTHQYSPVAWQAQPCPLRPLLHLLLPGPASGPVVSTPLPSTAGSLHSSPWLQGPWICSLEVGRGFQEPGRMRGAISELPAPLRSP